MTTPLTVRRELFGGAVECQMPPAYEDVSFFREIPDNEEVFHESTTDSALVVDILELSQDVADENIAEFQFQDIAEANEARSFNVQEKGVVDFTLEGGHSFTWCGGIQSGIVKFREQETLGNDVYVFVGVCRLKQYNTDVVISVSAPIRISEASSSYKLGSIPDSTRGKAVFEHALASFRIKDYSLFA